MAGGPCASGSGRGGAVERCSGTAVQRCSVQRCIGGAVQLAARARVRARPCGPFVARPYHPPLGRTGPVLGDVDIGPWRLRGCRRPLAGPESPVAARCLPCAVAAHTPTTPAAAFAPAPSPATPASRRARPRACHCPRAIRARPSSRFALLLLSSLPTLALGKRP